MFYVPQLPCYKIYKKANHAMQIVCFESEISTGHFSQDCVGSFLIEFLEMDLTEYIDAINGLCEGGQFNTTLLFELDYRKTKEQLLSAASLLADNLHLHRLLVGVMKMVSEDESLSDMEQLEKAYLELLYIVQMYNQFSNALLFCLDADNYTEIGIVQKLNVANAGLETQLDAVQNEQGGVSLLPFTWILSFEDLIFYDFLELVSRGLPVKQCKLCGKFFVQKTKHKTEYCDRKTENGRTCKQIGPKILFNAELAKPGNATLKEYDRIRKMKQQKLEHDRNKETGRAVGKAQAVYDKWSEKAAVLREQFVKGEILDEELLTKINL